MKIPMALDDDMANPSRIHDVMEKISESHIGQSKCLLAVKSSVKDVASVRAIAGLVCWSRDVLEEAPKRTMYIVSRCMFKCD